MAFKSQVPNHRLRTDIDFRDCSNCWMRNGADRSRLELVRQTTLETTCGVQSDPDAYLGMSNVQVPVWLWREPRQHLSPCVLEMLRQPLFRVRGPPYPPVTIPDLRVHLRIQTNNKLVGALESSRVLNWFPVSCKMLVIQSNVRKTLKVLSSGNQHLRKSGIAFILGQTSTDHVKINTCIRLLVS